MSREERTGWRDMAYSLWHRCETDDPRGELAMIDGDANEVCKRCYETLAVFELCASLYYDNKPTTATRKRAKRLGVHGFALLYNGYGGFDHAAGKDRGFITRARIKRLHPNSSDSYRDITPRQLEALLWNIHRFCPYCGYAPSVPEWVPLWDGYGLCIHGMVGGCRLCEKGRAA